MMKKRNLKLLSLLIVIVLLCGTMALPASAAGVVVRVNHETASRGQTVTFTATLSESVSALSGAVTISYNKSVLRLERGTWSVGSTTLAHVDLATGLGAFACGASTAIEGVVFTATFTVLDTAPAGDSPVGLALQLRDASNKNLALSNVGGRVTVSDAAGLAVNVNDAAARVEETVVFTATLSKEVTVKSGGVTLSYDKSALQLVSGVWSVEGATISHFDPATELGAFAFGSATALEGALFTATFRVLADAPVGSTEVGLILQLKDSADVALPIQNKGGRMTVKPAILISADVGWSSMAFTYTDGDWNPTKHDYEVGVWTPDAEDGGQITVGNEGNVQITASFTYTPSDPDISATFSKEQTVLEVGDTDTVSLALSGRPKRVMDGEQLGAVTVTIIKSGED